MARDNLSRREVEARLIVKAWEDDAFRAKLDDPKTAKKALEEELSEIKGREITFPDEWEIYIHEETETSHHIVLPGKTQEPAEDYKIRASLEGYLGDCISVGGWTCCRGTTTGWSVRDLK